jgi:hypothetical protein
MKNDDNFLDFIEKQCLFFRSVLGQLSPEQFFNPSVVPPTEVPEDSESYSIMNGVMARKENFSEKIDRLLFEGFSETNVNSILAPSKKEEADFLLMGKIYFKSSSQMMGEIDFLRKYVQNVLVKEFLFCSYRINYRGKHKMVEQTADWETGIKLIANSINDFEKSPDSFVKDRILKWQK